MIANLPRKMASLVSSVILIGLCGFLVQVRAVASRVQDDKVCFFVALNQAERGVRRMAILIDAADFTEKKLRMLSVQVFEKYPKPDSLEVDIKSHPMQLTDFADGPGRKMNEYARASFIRRGGNEIIRYRVPGSEQVTLVIKGKDPSTSR